MSKSGENDFLFVFFNSTEGRGHNILPTAKTGCLATRQACLLTLGAVVFLKNVLLEQRIQQQIDFFF